MNPPPAVRPATADRQDRLRAVYDVLGRYAPWLALAVYVVTLAVMIPRHEPWFDEAQAWLIARDAGLVELHTEALRYEGHPPLWYWALLVPAKLGLPYAAMHVVALLFAAAGAALFLWRAPLPWPVRILFPFTFYPLYQYAVIARSYALLPLLLFAAAALYPRRLDRPLAYVGVLCLLALLSAYSALAAGVLFLLLLADAVRAADTFGQAVRRMLPAGLLFGACTLLIVAMLWPPADHMHAAEWTLAGGLRGLALRFGAVLNIVLTESFVLSGLVVVLSVALWWRRGVAAAALLPFLAVLAFALVKYRMLWHDGILFLLWLFGIWIALDGFVPATRADRWLRRATVAAVAVVLGLQVVWGLYAYARDLRYPYTGARELADLIEARGLDEESLYVAVTDSSHFRIAAHLPFAVQPYFDQNLFVNLGGPEAAAFPVWRAGAMALATPEVVAELHARGVAGLVHPVLDWAAHDVAPPTFEGYRLAGTTRGYLIWKDDYWMRDAYFLYVLDEEAPPADATHAP